MADLATLGLAVYSRSASEAARDLRRLTDTTVKVESAVRAGQGGKASPCS